MTLSYRRHMSEHEVFLEPGSLSARLTVGHDLPVFQGHFPGRPLLPGFLVVHLVFEYALQLVGKPLRLRSIDKARFHAPILPGDMLDVTLRYDAAVHRVSATLLKNGAKTAVVRMTVSVL
ncbi:MAG: hypothetical protein HY788_14695 [Deltaproteobacteria bacterium]|nr:hypothetical protein [Deltaproteobacteria bacterium]